MVGAIPKSSMRDFGRPINQNSNSNLKQEGNVPTSYTSTTAARQHAHSKLTGAVWLAAMLVCTAVSAVAQVQPCQGPGAPMTTQTKCLTAIVIPGNPLRSFDISWVGPERAEYYLADRSNFGVDIINTKTLAFKTTITGFIGIKLNPNGKVDNDHSGPDGVVSHGKWLYAGDGDSTLKVFDISDPTNPVLKATVSTGGTTRVDEMALSTDGELLLVANNAEDPPFATLFRANGDNNS